MSKLKVVVTKPLFPSACAVLDQYVDAEYWTEPERISRDELLRRVSQKDGLICLPTERIDSELLDAGPKLRMIATASVGYDHVDVAACTKRGIVVSNTPGVLTDTTADLAWGLLMAVARRVVEGDSWTRSGTWNGFAFDTFLGGDVWGKTLGIVGFGRIGREMARRSLGFKMRVLYFSQNRAPERIEQELHAEFAPLEILLHEADFVSLHVPLLPSTRHLISADSFAKMKPTAYLINTARGPVVDEGALVQALETAKIAGAALDVYEHEPKVHPGLLLRKNVVLAPHIGSATIETRTRMAQTAVENIVAFFSGRKPPNGLNAPAS
ncbi:MAG TPA: D-glycerate dehydrogenase [Candidatus Acidoferrales bacterium]|nr:D-glycerate dehydrogenase [Candidatus Acidoferrales bacterium]